MIAYRGMNGWGMRAITTVAAICDTSPRIAFSGQRRTGLIQFSTADGVRGQPGAFDVAAANSSPRGCNAD
jgi:hypothetical protein